MTDDFGQFLGMLAAERGRLALTGTLITMLLLFSLVGYIFGSYVLYRIGRKFGIGSFGRYFIPVYNYVLLCRCGEISPWLLFLLPIPVANVVFVVYLWGTIANKLGHNFWLFGLGTLLLGVPALVLAFDSSQPPVPTKPAVGPFVECIAGEFSGSRVPVQASGLTIGRNAEKANLVISSSDVSAVHARLWSDADGRVWVEDMRSSNGTYYWRPVTGEAPEWIQVGEPVALLSGTHIRLGDNAVEFVVS